MPGGFGEQDPMMGGQDPMAGGPDGSPEDDFGGEDSEVELDPKKEIQKMTGELSQKLRLYNDENNDQELSKYVAGMIVAQAAKNLNNKDKKEIVQKMNRPEDEMEDMVDGGDMGEGQDVDESGQMDGGDMKLEGKTYRCYTVNEVANKIMSKRAEKRPSKEMRNHRVTKNNPFVR